PIHTLHSFSFPWYPHPRASPSFPTRRSSDLLTLHQPSPGGGLENLACCPGPAPVFCQRSYPGPARRSRLHRTVENIPPIQGARQDRKSARLNSSHVKISYAVFCLKKKKKTQR